MRNLLVTILLLNVVPFLAKAENSRIGKQYFFSQQDVFKAGAINISREVVDICSSNNTSDPANLTRRYTDTVLRRGPNISHQKIHIVCGNKPLGPLVEGSSRRSDPDENYDTFSGDDWLAYEVESRGSEFHEAIFDSAISQLLSEHRFYDVLSILSRTERYTNQRDLGLRMEFLAALTDAESIFLVIDIIEEIKPWFEEQRLSRDLRLLSQRLSAEGFPDLASDLLYFVDLPSRRARFGDSGTSDVSEGVTWAEEEVMSSKQLVKSEAAQPWLFANENVTVLEAEQALERSEAASKALIHEFQD